MTTERPTGPERVVLDAVDEALNELDAVAHAPVQGESMHKAIAAHVLHDLDAHGYAIVRKEAVDYRWFDAEGLP